MDAFGTNVESSMKSDSMTIWFSVSEPRVYYRIPSSASLPSGESMLSNLSADVRRVNIEALSSFVVSKSEALSNEMPVKAPSLDEKEATSVPKEEDVGREHSKTEDSSVAGVLGVLRDVVSDGLMMGEDLLSSLDHTEVASLARDVVDEALEVVSEIIDSDSEDSKSDTAETSMTGLHLRTLFRQGLRDVKVSVKRRNQEGSSDKG